MDLHRFYRCAMVFLDVLEELGRCAALDFVIWCFSYGYLFSHGIHGTHGNAVAAPVCHSELVSPTNFTNFTNIYRCAMVLSPTDYTDFSFFDSLFCFAKIALWIYTDFIAARWFF